MAGRMAVKYAVAGETDKMVVFKREEGPVYKISYELLDVSLAANTEKKVPREWINKAGNGIEQPFVDYALPLIQGDSKAPLVNGLPRFAKLEKVLVKK